MIYKHSFKKKLFSLYAVIMIDVNVDVSDIHVRKHLHIIIHMPFRL